MAQEYPGTATEGRLNLKDEIQFLKKHIGEPINAPSLSPPPEIKEQRCLIGYGPGTDPPGGSSSASELGELSFGRVKFGLSVRPGRPAFSGRPACGSVPLTVL